MRSLLARLAVLGVFAVSVSACSSGHDSSLPVAGPPNNNGGTISNLQTGANGTALIRFVQGSPDVGQVDVCIDQTTATAATKVAFKGSTLIGVAGGIPHIVSVYAASGGSECATAPGPFTSAGSSTGTSPIAFTSFTPAVNTRTLVALAGRAGTTLGLYAWISPTFANVPTGPEAIAYNAAPTFGNVGFGYLLTATSTPTNLTGATNLAAPKPGTSTSITPAATTFSVTAPLPGVPASFFVGKGVTTGTVVPIKTVAAITPAAGQAYVVDLIAVDSAVTPTSTAPLDVVQVIEATTGYGF
jgi:hypothetical protein